MAWSFWHSVIVILVLVLGAVGWVLRGRRGKPAGEGSRSISDGAPAAPDAPAADGATHLAVDNRESVPAADNAVPPAVSEPATVDIPAPRATIDEPAQTPEEMSTPPAEALSAAAAATDHDVADAPTGTGTDPIAASPADESQLSTPGTPVTAPEPTEDPEPAADDDFRRIQGIGPKIANALHAAGIRTYRQLAELDEAALRDTVRNAGLRAAPGLASWPQQARVLTDARAEAEKPLPVAAGAGEEV